jgi:DNA-binding CsgD family transcriptional regulator
VSSQGTHSAEERIVTHHEAIAPDVTPVERRLLELVAAGRPLVAAGAELALDVRGVITTVTGLRDRFGVRSTAAAVRRAHAAGLIGAPAVQPRLS